MPITRENFTEWTKTCGVRNIQSKFEEVITTAKSKKITPEEEMKERGLKNYQAFTKTCDQFSLFCWPEEFAELGSGFVLYFYFLFFLGSILAIAFALQIPAMATYSGEDFLVGWEHHKWSHGLPWADTDDNCQCTGEAGPEVTTQKILEPSYGKSCGAWDLESCKILRDSSGQDDDLPQWCCASWCFADKSCVTPETDKNFEQNHLYLGAVRAVSECPINLEIMKRHCAKGKDEVFPHGKKVSEDKFIAQSWLTPGNFGPDQADNALIPLLHFIIVAALAYVIIFVYQHQIRMDSKVDAGTTSPNDFAILVKGLPRTATDEATIMQFFRENAVKGKTDTEIVKVVIGWDIEEFREKIKKIRDLMKTINEMDPTDPQVPELRKQAAEINADLGSAAPDKASRLKSSGVVVVVFRYQADLRACLERWTSFWARWYYCDNERACCLDGLVKGAALRRFPIGDKEVSRLSIERAPNPGDIHWEELGKDPTETRVLFLKTNGIMALLIILTGLATWGLNKAEEEAVEKGETGGAGFKVLQYIVPFGVMVVNMTVMISAKILGDREYHETWTSQEFSQGVKMAVALLVNTGGVLLWSNIQPKEWYQKGGLIDDAFLILLIDAVVPPIILSFDIKYSLINRWRRNRLTQEKIDAWNKRLEETKGTPEFAKASKEVEAQVNAMKKFFEPSEINNPRRYANALNTFIVCLWYSPVLPFTCLIGIAGMFMQYWMDKYLLLRWYKRPKRPYNAYLAQFSLRMIKYTGPIGFTICFYFFLTPSWATRSQVTGPFLFAIIVCAVLMAFPSNVLRTLLGMRLMCGSSDGYSDKTDEMEDYYHSQFLWSKEMKYHKDHFLYKCLPEAKNPEMLTKGEEAVTKFDDVKASYGAAVEKATHEDERTSAGAALKGGHYIGEVSTDERTRLSGTSGDGAAYGAGAASPAPAPPEPVSYGAPAAADADAEAPKPVAPTPHPPAPKPTVWEFSNNHGGFSSFADDCQEYIERKYQEFQGGGQARVKVRTGGKQISLDFEKMTQMVEGSHKVRSIKRS